MTYNSCMHNETRARQRISRQERGEIVFSLRKAREEIQKPVKLGWDIDFWPINDSSVQDYQNTFTRLEISLVEHIRNRKSPVVIDLLSSPTAVRELLLSTTDSKTTGISVALGDHRNEALHRIDDRLGIHHVVGDLSKPATWKEVEKNLNGRKADLILERGYAGVAYLPHHAGYYLSAIDKVWDMLTSNNGIFLADTMQSFLSHDRIVDWILFLQNQGIDAKYGANSLMIERHSDSPNSLPRPS